MKKLIKGKHLAELFLVFVFCIFAFTGCNSTASRYNENPDVSKKIIGSDNGFISKFMPPNLETILANSTVVIMGEVLEDDNVYTFPAISPDEDELGIGTIAKVKVIETIAGTQPSEEIISYYQCGAPKTDNLQTKVKKGQKCIFILKYFEDKDYYYSAAMEEGIFMVDENNELLSMSKQKFCAKYDGIKKDILIEDIRNTKFLNN